MNTQSIYNISRMFKLSCFSFLALSLLPLVEVRADSYIYDDEIEYALAERAEAERRDLKQSPSSNIAAAESDVPKQLTTFADPRFSGAFKLDFKSQYISFGVVLQDEGLTIQPMLALRYTFYDDKIDSNKLSYFNNITGFISSWNDFSTNEDLSSSTYPYRNFTEADLVAGISLTFEDRFNLTTSFTALESPAGAFAPGAFVKAVLSMDDTGMMAENFAIKPRLLLIYEIPWEAQIGLQPEAFLFEPGVTPTYTFGADSDLPISLSLPMRAGLGNKFYDGKTYGFFSVGPQFTAPLMSLSSNTIKTYVDFGYTYTNLGKTTRDFILNENKSSHKHVVNLGLLTTF
jgi:hypothetical protein